MFRSAGMNDEWSQQKPKMEKHKTGAALQILVFACEPFALFKFVSKSKTWPQRPLVLNSRSATLRAAKKPQLQVQHKVQIKTNTDGWTPGSICSLQGRTVVFLICLNYFAGGSISVFPLENLEVEYFSFLLRLLLTRRLSEKIFLTCPIHPFSCVARYQRVAQTPKTQGLMWWTMVCC